MRDLLETSLNQLPRLELAHLPTPLEDCPRLSAALGDVRLLIKRDDLTGLAFGGNKTRQLEYTLGEALAKQADCIVQGAASQSNHCRQTAAACARLGLECFLCLRRDDHSEPVQGNLLLDFLFGARIRFFDCGMGNELEAAKEALAEELRAEGRHPYLIGGLRANLLGAAGIAGMALELDGQLRDAGIAPDCLYVCSAGPTGAGLLLAVKAIPQNCALVGIAPIAWPYDPRTRIAEIAAASAREFGLPLEFQASEVRLHEEYVGPGYGVVTRESKAAVELLARTEGILLNPVYTGKAMAGLIDHVRRGVVPLGSTVVFIHTGGTPALFAYAEEIL